MKNIFLFLFVWSNFAICQEKAVDNKIDSLPVLVGSINDFENILEFHQEIILEESVKSFYEYSGIGITVVTVESIEPYDSISDYSIDLGNYSNKGKVLIVVSKKLRQIQILNSDDILEKLTDEETKKIIDQFIIPRFKQEKYYAGLLDGIAEIKKELVSF